MKDNAMPPENDIELLARLEKRLRPRLRRADRRQVLRGRQKVPHREAARAEHEQRTVSRAPIGVAIGQGHVADATQLDRSPAARDADRFQESPHPVQRACRIGDDVWYDLKDDDGNALRISADRTNLSVERTPDSVCWLRGSTMKRSKCRTLCPSSTPNRNSGASPI